MARAGGASPRGRPRNKGEDVLPHQKNNREARTQEKDQGFLKFMSSGKSSLLRFSSPKVCPQGQARWSLEQPQLFSGIQASQTATTHTHTHTHTHTLTHARTQHRVLASRAQMKGQRSHSAVGRGLLSWMSKQGTQKPGANCHPGHIGKALDDGLAGQGLLTRLCLLSHISLLRDLLCAGYCARLQGLGASLAHIVATLGSQSSATEPQGALGVREERPNNYSSQHYLLLGFPGGASRKEPACQCRRHKRHRFNPWVGKIPWRRKRQPTPVFLSGKSLWTEEPGGLQSIGSQSQTQLRRLSTHATSYKYYYRD